LIGIALDEGYISSIDQPIADYLQPFFHTKVDSKKSEITIRHLLTMTAGLQWEELVTNGHIELQANWIQGILDLPLVDPPGTTFNYSTGYSHLLSAVLTEASGMNTCEFAQAYLFDPIGVSVDHWGLDPQSYFAGGWQLFITTREMARFGLLYLQNGEWAGHQIIPKEWIQASWSHQVTLEPQHQFNYGFYWWNTSVHGYAVHTAWGYGGQMLHIIPELDLLLVLTSNPEYVGTIHETDGFSLLEDSILPVILKQ
jgi:CubicO group peptidase (beta-lactamase class C family)